MNIKLSVITWETGARSQEPGARQVFRREEGGDQRNVPHTGQDFHYKSGDCWEVN